MLTSEESRRAVQWLEAPAAGPEHWPAPTLASGNPSTPWRGSWSEQRWWWSNGRTTAGCCRNRWRTSPGWRPPCSRASWRTFPTARRWWRIPRWRWRRHRRPRWESETRGAAVGGGSLWGCRRPHRIHTLWWSGRSERPVWQLSPQRAQRGSGPGRERDKWQTRLRIYVSTGRTRSSDSH